MYISYSALDAFTDCPFRFKLKYVDKVPHDRGSLHTAFGNGMHKTIQLVLLTPTLSIEDTFKFAFRKELKELPEKIKQKIFSDKDLRLVADEMADKGPALCRQAIDQLNIDFPGFKIIGVEQKFVEPVIDYLAADYEFKGVIDLVIQTPDGRYHIIDWKTCSWGWDGRKKNDKMVTYQLTYYKHYFCLQNNLDVKDVDAHFALIKRTAKKDNTEIFQVPVGEKKISNALKVLNNMVYNVDHKRFPKNRLSCTYCDFHKTVWCP